MAIFKCKMCGGSLEVTAGETIIECEYCGTQQTLPKTTDENVQSLFNRANLLRQKSEFDKAEAVYEKILAADETESEAYWGVILCKFGIEYVEDPTTYKRVPTCHRTSYDSIIADEYYKKALEHADATQRAIYEREAKQIDEIQKGILAISAQEEPYDVFICYKETDESGKRTQDSVIANDIYHQLTTEGFKVFYAAITLEDKLGSAYEPIIFAALNSSKVMLSIGTKPEYFNAVWVKNEWSRFLKMMKNDRSKMLIPCYKGMDAYELPEEFAHLQAQDMGKIGFINDIVRGIKKVVIKDEPKATVVKETVVTTGNANTAPLLKRAFMFLEDGDWDSADEYCEKVLDIDPENAQAYVGKLMAELEVRLQERLKDEDEPFDDSSNYQKALRFADEALKAKLVADIEYINTRNENARLDGIYKKAKEMMASAKTEVAYKDAASKFETISEYRDSANLAKECHEKAEEARKDDILSRAKRIVAGEGFLFGEGVSLYENTIRLLESIPGWKDADEQIAVCKVKIEALTAKEENDRKEAEKRAKRNKKIAIIASAAVCVLIALAVITVTVIVPAVKYNNAVALMDAGKYDEAIAAFEALDGHKDSAEMILECKYGKAVALMEAGKYDAATAAFNVISAYKDSAEMKLECKYLKAAALMEAGKYKDARSAFENISTYKDSKEKAEECSAIILESDYNKAVALLDAGKYEEAKSAFRVISTYKDSSTQMKECDYRSAVALMKAGKYAEAITTFNTLGSYKDSKEKIAECNAVITENNYKNAVALMDAGKYTAAITAFNALGSYKDSVTQKNTCISLAYNNAVALMKAGRCAEAAFTFGVLGNYKDAQKLWMTSSSNTIAAGNSHVVGLKKDGTVVAAGENENGECNVGSWKNIVSVDAAVYHTVGLKSDGTVVATGENSDGQCNVSGWKNIVAVAAGRYHTVGLKSDGTVVATGKNSVGQCNVRGWTDIVAVTAGIDYTVGLKSNGTVLIAGECYYKEKVLNWTNIVAISADTGVSITEVVGLKSNGTVVTTGYGVNEWRDIIAVAAGDGHTVGLKADGTVVAAGSNYYRQCDVDYWTDIVDVAACNEYTIGLKSNGTVVYTGELDYYMKKMSSWYNIKTP